MKQQKTEEYLHKFDDILDNDEKIVKVFKPSKTRCLYLSIITDIINLIMLCPAMCYLVLYINDFKNIGLIVGIIVGIYVLMVSWHQVEKFVKYSHTFYAYTQKRILICSGFFGIDYTYVDLQTIGAVHVNVGLLDKLVKPNKSGTIIFSSISQVGLDVCFEQIDDPYKVYKEIKEHINSVKSKLNFDGVKYVENNNNKILKKEE